MKGEYEEGEFGFSNDFSVRFDNLDYDQVGRDMPNIARVRNCPDVTVLNSLFGLRLFVLFFFFLLFFFSFFVQTSL